MFVQPADNFSMADYDLFEQEELTQAEGLIYDEINDIKRILK